MEKNLINHNGPEDGSFLRLIDRKDRLYQVPHSYFEGLAAEIMARIRRGQDGKQMGYQVPEGYFAGFAQQVLHKIKNEAQTMTGTAVSGHFREQDIIQELKEVAPLLLKIGNRNVYRVPSTYFDDLKPLEPVQTFQQEAVKVIPLSSKRKFWRAVVAAAAVLGVLFSGERYFNNHHLNKSQPNVSSNQFAATIPNKNDSFQQNLSGLSDWEIMNYLKSPPDLSIVDSIKNSDATETQQAISGMTNEELETYLDRTPATY